MFGQPQELAELGDKAKATYERWYQNNLGKYLSEAKRAAGLKESDKLPSDVFNEIKKRSENDALRDVKKRFTKKQAEEAVKKATEQAVESSNLPAPINAKKGWIKRNYEKLSGFAKTKKGKIILGTAAAIPVAAGATIASVKLAKKAKEKRSNEKIRKKVRGF